MPRLAALFAVLAVATATRNAAKSTPHGRRAALSHAASTYSRTVPGFEDVHAAFAAPVASNGRRLSGLPASRLNLSSIVSVLDFGAVGDGVTDNTAAFNSALASLAPVGGIVFVPAGRWAFQGSIIMTPATSLVGTYVTVPSHGLEGAPMDGSVLMPMGGRGVEAGAFINMTEDCTVRGFTVYYPGNPPDAAPAAYPWTIAMAGNNNAVQARVEWATRGTPARCP